MDKYYIAETLFWTDIVKKDEAFVYLKHKLVKLNQDYRILSPKCLISKWEHITPILASDVGIVKKGIKNIYKVPINEFYDYINYYDHTKILWDYCKGHNLTKKNLEDCNCK